MCGSNFLKFSCYGTRGVDCATKVFLDSNGKLLNRALPMITEWLIECCLMCSHASGKYFIHIQDESILRNDDDEWTLLCTRLIFNVLANESNNMQEDMPLYPGT